MTRDEQFQEDCKAPVDIDQCHEALTRFINHDGRLRIPVNIYDDDMLLSRALQELKEFREAKLLDRQKLLEWLKDEIESCAIVADASDKAIIWELNRLWERIEEGRFDR